MCVLCEVDNDEEEKEQVCHGDQVQLGMITSVNMMGMSLMQLWTHVIMIKGVTEEEENFEAGRGTGCFMCQNKWEKKQMTQHSTFNV